jgi:hypothetical protein
MSHFAPLHSKYGCRRMSLRRVPWTFPMRGSAPDFSNRFFFNALAVGPADIFGAPGAWAATSGEPGLAMRGLKETLPELPAKPAAVGIRVRA